MRYDLPSITPALIFGAVVSLSICFHSIAAETTAVQRIEALTPAQRSSLPDATSVVLAGRTTTLGTLRQEHTARMKRFANAATNAAHLLVTINATLARTLPTGRLVPMQVQKGMAIDYELFCSAAAASGCLYFPPGVLYPSVGNTVVDVDVLITDASVCQSRGWPNRFPSATVDGLPL